MSNDPAPFGTSALLPDTPLPAEQMPMGTPDMPAISRVRSDAHAWIKQKQGDPVFRDRLLRGDPEAMAELQRNRRIVNSPVNTIYGNEQSPGQIDAKEQAWQNFADIGVAFGADVERQFRDGQPITEGEYRQAQAKLAELKSDREFVRRLFDGGRKERSIWQLVHRMIASPVVPDKP